jgi:transposase
MTMNASTQRMTLGLDVSDRFTHYCLLDETGEVLEEGRLRTNQAAIRQRFEGPACRVVIEAGTHSPWLSRLLTDAGHEVVVANPRRVQLIAQSVRKNDRTDAETLARLGRIDPKLLSPITHRSAEAQADLAIIRARSSLVAARTLLINHVRGAVKSLGERLPACDAHSFHRRAMDFLPESVVVALTPLVDTIGKLTEQIRELDGRLSELVAIRYPEARLLQQVPGVGQLISLAYILTIGDPGRFKTSREVGPYLGLVPRQRESGDSVPEMRISKAGDRYLRLLLVQGAHYVLGYRGPDSDLRRWGLEKAAGGKRAKKRAVVAVARKLAILLHRLWVTGEVYSPLRVPPVAA